MNAIDRNEQNTSGMIVKETFKTKRIAARDNKSSRFSTSKENENTFELSIAEGKACEQTTDAMLLRQTTASIADALLCLGGCDNSSDTSFCVNSKNKRKRSISLVEDSDSCSAGTQSIDTETDVSSTDTAKRHRRPTSHEFSMISTKRCLDTSTMTSVQDERIESDLSLSDGNSKIEHKSTQILGNIGCVFPLSHQDFRPLPAAPRLPKGIVAESIPPIHSIYFPQAPSSTKAPLYSTEITEHNNFVIMHSYTVLPRTIPYEMAQIQVPNAF